VALVTGAARGIGLAIATALAADGARIALVDRAPVDRAAEAIGGGARGFRCDLADAAAVARIAADVADWGGCCDILVHGAALYPTTPLDTLTLAEWRAVMAVNLDAAMLLARALAPGMRSRGWGRMVFIASGTIGTTRRDIAAYVSSKMGLIGLARALASDLGPHGVTANAVAPGFTETEGTREKFAEFDALAAKVVRGQAIPRLVRKEEVAATAAFLCTDGAGMITGQTLMVDGGTVRL
jgi:3-oxoacyl-[acyl-carrier protein] reductase/(S)-1-phenylethanol dehydrogenase